MITESYGPFPQITDPITDSEPADDPLLSLAGGPFSKVQPKYVAEVIAHFYTELVYLNRLSSLESCAVNGEEVVNSAMGLFTNIEGGADAETGMQSGFNTALAFANALKDC